MNRQFLIRFPKIGTTAADSETGDHLAKADEEVTIVDTVKYENHILSVLHLQSQRGQRLPSPDKSPFQMLLRTESNSGSDFYTEEIQRFD